MTAEPIASAKGSNGPSAPSRNFRRVATRYDKLARNFLAAVEIAAVILWWT
jgi:transposase